MWKPTEIVLGDVGTFLVQLSKELRAAKIPDAKWADWYSTLRDRELKREIEIKEYAFAHNYSFAHNSTLYTSVFILSIKGNRR